MANKKISELPAATTPLAGTELLEIVQGGDSKKVAANELRGTATLQEVLDTGSVLDKSNTVDAGGHNLIVNNVGNLFLEAAPSDESTSAYLNADKIGSYIAVGAYDNDNFCEIRVIPTGATLEQGGEIKQVATETAGLNATFTTNDGKTVTVVNGMITSIV